MFIASRRYTKQITKPALLGPKPLGGALLNLTWPVGMTLLLITAIFGGAGDLLNLTSATLLALLALGLALQPSPKLASGWLVALGVIGCISVFWAATGLLPAAWLGVNPHPFFSTLSAFGLTASWPALGANPAGGVTSLVLLVAYFALGVTLLKRAQDEAQSLIMVKTVAWVGLAFTGYALLVFISGNTHVLWQPKAHYPEALTGSFISRNQAATYLGLTMLACTALGLQRIGEVSRQLAPLQRLRALWLLVARPGWPWLLGALLAWLALILTTSRAGLAFTALGLLAMLVGLAIARAAVRWWLLGAVAVAMLVGLLTLAVAGAGVAERSAAGTHDALGRQAINHLSMAATQTMPISGHGLGGWEGATALVRKADLFNPFVGELGNAHNLYWQTVTELGWPGLAMLLAVIGLALALLINGLQTRRRQVIFPALGLGTLVLVAGHSAFDFPLHLPAIALATLLLITPALAKSLKTEQAPPSPRWAKYAYAALTLPVFFASGWLLWEQIPYSQSAPVLASLKEGRLPSKETLRTTRENLARCQARAAWHTGCLEGMMLVHWARAQQMGVQNFGGQVLLKAAALQGERALTYAPANPMLAYQLYRIYTLRGEAALANRYLAHSILMGPHESRLAYVRARVLVQALEAAAINPSLMSADDRDLFMANLRELWTQDAVYLWHHLQHEKTAQLQLANALAAGPLPVDKDLWHRVTRGAPWPLGNLAPTP